ncbi:tyrosine-type recombinase/integrase [Neobacillus vireti]
MQKGYIEKNPYDNVHQLRKRHEVGATFTKRQLKRLLDAPDTTTFIGLRDLAIMLTFAHTGIRLTELASLRVQDVSFDGKGAINVQRAKNRFARRIPLTRRLKEVLSAYIEERGILNHDSLFITVENEPIGPRSIQDRLRQYGMQTEVSNEVTVSPHAFRRTFCRLKVEAGTNIFVLQRLTGHQSLEILKRYVEIYGRDLEAAIEQGFEGL